MEKAKPWTKYNSSFLHADGSYTILYESFLRHDLTIERDKPKYVDYYKDIIAIKISKEGKLINIATSDKLQADALKLIEMFTSFKAIENNGELHILYGEERKGSNRQNTNFKKSSLYTVKLNTKGDFEAPKKLFDQTEGYAFSPKYTVFTNDNMLMVPFIDTKFSNSNYNSWDFDAHYAFITIK